MAETSLVAFAIAACGAMTLLILARAMRDVLAEHDDQAAETEG